MRRLSFLLFLPALIGAEYEIDTAHSAAAFSVRHMMVSTVRGQFAKTTGTIQYTPGRLQEASVTATIDASTIQTNEPKRDEHLRSPDFFEVTKFPAITFQSTKWTAKGAALEIAGNLTIHGTTRPVVLQVSPISPEVKDPWGQMRIGTTATTKINRNDFGLKWNKALEAGGLLVGDEVTITLDIQATRKK